LLVDSFLQRAAPGRHRLAVEPAAMARLQAHDWPGNIRELRNVLERARLFADDGIVRTEHLPESLTPGLLRPGMPQAPLAMGATTPAPQAPRPAEIGDADLRQLAASADCTRKELARRAGLSERTLYRRLKALGLA
jgi:transcriptional regulator of acetoin/glycerol metabolism